MTTQPLDLQKALSSGGLSTDNPGLVGPAQSSFGPANSTPQTGNITTQGLQNGGLQLNSVGGPKTTVHTVPTDLSANYGLNQSTVYRKNDNYAFSNPDEFFKDAGVNSFGGLSFDNTYNPGANNFSGSGALSNVSTEGYGAYGNPSTGLDSQPTQNISLDPSSNTDTNNLSQPPTTNEDIYSVINDNFKQQQTLIQKTLDAINNNPAIDIQNAALNLDQSYREGSQNIMAKPIPLEFQQGQQAALSRDYGIQASGLANLLTSANTSQQQKLQGLQFAFDSSKSSLSNIIDLYTKVAPQNIGTQYNPNTGDLYTITKSPLNGQVQVALAANIGPQKSYTSTNVVTDPLTGGLIFIGTRADGSVEEKPLGAGGTGTTDAGNAPYGGTITAPPIQSAGVNTAAQLLNYYVTGNANKAAGYVPAALAQAGINPNTPISQLQGKVPQLAAAVAKNESGYNPQTGQFSPNIPLDKNVGARTNNPGNILWSTAKSLGYDTQFGATAYKSSNGYTYARFSSPQVGFDALQSYLQSHIGGGQVASTGGVQTASSNTSGGQQPQVTLNQIQNAAPLPIKSSIAQTSDGNFYIDMSKIDSAGSAAANNFYAQMHAAGIPITKVTGDQASTLKNIDTSKTDLQAAVNQILPYLPGGALARDLGGGLLNKVAGKLQVGARGTAVASYNSFRTTAIQTLRAAAGSAGLRINEAEILQSVANDIPTDSDTQAVAQQKIANVLTQLQSVQNSILGMSHGTSSSADPLGILGTH